MPNKISDDSTSGTSGDTLRLTGETRKAAKKAYRPLETGVPKDWATFERIEKVLARQADLKEEFDIETSGEVVSGKENKLGMDAPRAQAKAAPGRPGQRAGQRYSPPGYDAARDPRAGRPRSNGAATVDEDGNIIDVENDE